MNYSIGVDGSIKGDKGDRGPVGTKGILGTRRERYVLSYCGIVFEIDLKPETFAMIEDATYLNGDELEFIRVMDKEEWEIIREGWAMARFRKQSYEAFERGEWND